MESSTLTDGYYEVDDEGDECFIAYVHNGVIGDDKVEWYLEQGYTFKRVHVLSEAEYADLEARANASSAGAEMPDGFYSAAAAALGWLDEIYPPDIFIGKDPDADEGVKRVAAIRENLRQALQQHRCHSWRALPQTAQEGNDAK